ncbi:MAG TPA: alkaline phosphatase PafA [Chitinophagaceae bacterium]|nr:alkaline phosphatase PafA [Chitinophagaceae bacterium]
MRWGNLICIPALSFCLTTPGQPAPAQIQRPRLVIGIVVDQMRWDFLYRFYDQYGTGGFRRLMEEGYSCNNVRINYLPSVTATGHTCIFTGSVPALTGITGDGWIDQRTGLRQYCVSDTTVRPVGGSLEAGEMSPAHLLVSTVTDELRLATNNRSRVVGISLKDRAAILPAGHMANAAFWFDDSTGHFMTSTYYMPSLPQWVDHFNSQDLGSKLVSGEWRLLLPARDYGQSTPDRVSWEGLFPGEKAPVFPHRVSALYQRDRGTIRTTPFGNTLTLAFARAAIAGYGLGRGFSTDFLTINCASTDYVGHQFGPNSMEAEDTYLRLDRDLASFFTWLDAKIGRGNYLVLLTADHGVAHTLGFMRSEKLPSGSFPPRKVAAGLNQALRERFGVDHLVRRIMNCQVNLDLEGISGHGLHQDSVVSAALDYLDTVPGVARALDLSRISSADLPEPVRTLVVNGYYPPRSGQIQLILQPGWLEGFARTGTMHGAWNPYDTHVPLLFMGWHIRHGSDFLPYSMTDIAPTVAALLHIQPPNGCIGNPIEAVVAPEVALPPGKVGFGEHSTQERRIKASGGFP